MRVMIIGWIIAMCVLTVDIESSTAQEGLAEMKAELAELRKELAAVRRERDSLRKELSAMKGESTSQEPRQPEGEINGIVWEISAFRPDGTLVATKNFLALDGKIYNANKEVGTYTESGYRARVEVTRSDLPRANGTYQFVRISNNPPSYSGRFTNSRGDDIAVRLRIVKD